MDDLKKIAKSSGMTIYYYREGEIVPEEDNSIIQFDYQQTNVESLNDRVSSCELIGFRLKSLDLKHSGKVTIYKYDANYVPQKESNVNTVEETKQFDIDSYLSLEQTYKENHEKHFSEVCSYFKQFDSFEKIGSIQILKQCELFANLHPNAIKKGRLQNVIGDYYDSIGESTETKKWYNKAKKHGNNVKKGAKKEKKV